MYRSGGFLSHVLYAAAACFAALFFLSTIGAGIATAEIAPGEIIVKFKPSTGVKAMDGLNKSTGSKTIDEIKEMKIRRVKLPQGSSMDEAIEQYENAAGVEYAEPNYVRRALAVPNDTRWLNQWALPMINAPEAWDITTGSDVLVAVIDTGIDDTHPDLSAKVIGGYDFANDDDDPADDHWHGTHVAGTIAASTNNGQGIAGVSWGARLLAVKVLDEDGSGMDFDIALGIEYAADNGARVINMSLGGPDYSGTLASAVKYAQDRGCVVVAATGNDSNSALSYPAAYPNVIGVSSTTTTDTKASYSNYGWYVDVAAPGGNNDSEHPSYGILSCFAGVYAYASGTSMATPHVAGMAALIASRFPGRDGPELTRSVLWALDDIGGSGRDDYFGYGRINAQKAVTNTLAFDDDADAEFSGPWSTASSGYANGGSYRYSSSTDNYVTYTFTGTGVAWIARTNTACGIARVYIDDVYQEDVDLFGASDYQKPVYTKSGLEPGSHTIKIVVSGTMNEASSGYQINVDAFDTMMALPAPSTSAVALGNGIFNVSWSALSEEYDVDHYIVDVNSNETETSALTHTFTATPDTVYTVSVEAVDSIGNESEPDSLTAVLGNGQAVQTPSGDNIYVAVHATESLLPTTVFFESVSGSGETSVSVSTSTASALTGAVLLGGYFSVNSEASFSGDVRVTLPYDDTGLTAEEEQALKVYRYLSGAWADCTYAIDTTNDLITAGVTGLSTFAVGKTAADEEDEDDEETGGGGGGGGGSAPEPEPVEPEVEEVIKTLAKPAFADLLQSNWAYDYVAALLEKEVISGYEDGTFRPSAPVTRAEFAKMICAVMKWKTATPVKQSFYDVPPKHWAYGYIETARAHGAISGYPNGTFDPGRSVTRAEIAAMLATMLDSSNKSTAGNSFIDVGSHWAREQIKEGVNAGVIGGYPNNTFKPNNTATRAEAAKMIAKLTNS